MSKQDKSSLSDAILFAEWMGDRVYGQWGKGRWTIDGNKWLTTEQLYQKFKSKTMVNSQEEHEAGNNARGLFESQHGANVNLIEDQRKEALRHYHDACSVVQHWSGFVEAAIQAYNPSHPVPSVKQGQAEERETPKQIVEENFKGLDELIEDEDLRVWYKDLIVTCIEEYAASTSSQLQGEQSGAGEETEHLGES